VRVVLREGCEGECPGGWGGVMVLSILMRIDRSTTTLSKCEVCTDESQNEGHDIKFDIV